MKSDAELIAEWSREDAPVTSPGRAALRHRLTDSVVDEWSSPDMCVARSLWAGNALAAIRAYEAMQPQGETVRVRASIGALRRMADGTQHACALLASTNGCALDDEIIITIPLPPVPEVRASVEVPHDK